MRFQKSHLFQTCNANIHRQRWYLHYAYKKRVGVDLAACRFDQTTWNYRNSRRNKTAMVISITDARQTTDVAG